VDRPEGQDAYYYTCKIEYKRDLFHLFKGIEEFFDAENPYFVFSQIHVSFVNNLIQIRDAELIAEIRQALRDILRRRFDLHNEPGLCAFRDQKINLPAVAVAQEIQLRFAAVNIMKILW
jgi:hypothetical protein